MTPGQVFRKSWIILNDGSLPWENETIQIVNLINGIPFVHQPTVPITAPHSTTHLTMDFIAPMEEGVYESKWILSYREQTFGPMIWCAIQVKNTNQERLTEVFECVDVPLPACFDLTKPFQFESKTNSNRSSLHQSTSTLLTDDSVEQLSNNLDRINGNINSLSI